MTSLNRITVCACLAAFSMFAAEWQKRPPGGPGGPGFGRRGGEAPAPLAKDEGEKKILAAINQFTQSGPHFANVPVNDGRMLRLLAEAINAQTVVEFGTSTGFSGLWLSLALHRTGGKLITFEIDAGRAASARKLFEQAGVSQKVTIVEGDAHETSKKLKGPIDFVFIDADKEGYVNYLNRVLPLVRPGGLIVAHNVNPGMRDDGYVKAVTSNPDLDTAFYTDGGGMSITLKKR